MKNILLVILIATTSSVFSQDWPLKQLVTARKATGVSFVPIPAFSFVANKFLVGNGTYQALKLDASFSKQLLEQQPAAIKLAIPVSATETLVCDLVKFELGNIKFTQNNKDIVENVRIPVTYRGIVSNELKTNNVVLTVNENYLSLVATLSDKTYQITKADEVDKTAYRLYNSQKVQFPSVQLECGTSDIDLSAERAAQPTGTANRTDSSQSKCVNVFVDCFDSLYQWKNNSVQQSIDYVYELFSMVATGYVNERINIQIININVWTTADPYRGDTRENALADLAATYKDSFWGNICVGLDYSINAPKGRSGVAAGIGRAKGISPNTCPDQKPFCYNDLNYSNGIFVQNFPTGPNTTGQQVYLVMHEMGHLLGAHHTKWCGWKLTSNPDSYGALDSCGGMESIDTTKPTCAPGPPLPPSGATIMSYCVTGNPAGQFANFNNGFGPLPGAAIRNFVDNTLCIPKCADCTTSVNPRKNSTYAYATSKSGIRSNKETQQAYPEMKVFFTGKGVKVPPSP